MKKILSVVLAAILLLGVGAVGALAADAEELPGTYTLTGMEDGSDTDSAAMLEMMAAMGLSATLEIREDGSAEMDLFGSTMELQFDFTKKTATAEGDAIPYTYKDGVLEFHNEEVTMTFTKGESQDKYRWLAFDYYVAEAMVDDGERSEPGEDDESVTMMIFSDDSAIISFGEDIMPLRFDFDEMIVTLAADEGEELPFTLEDGLLTFGPDEDNYILFRLSDPGWEGSYTLVDVSSEGTEDMDEDEMDVLAAMGMLFKLSIDKDGKGSMEIFGESTTLYFDFDKMVVTDEEGDSEIPFTYENGVLTIAQDEESMSFKRILGAQEEAEPEEAEAEASAGTAAKSKK